jgi:hypothetical protein
MPSLRPLVHSKWGSPVLIWAWVPLALGLDALVPLGGQHLLGLATWILLLGLLKREDGGVRIQVAIVVVFASIVEYTFAGYFGVYVYRLENIPLFVSPGHGLIYLGALQFGRLPFVQARLRQFMVLVIIALGIWAIAGVTILERKDALGFFWYCWLVIFLLVGPSRGTYIGAAFFVTWLEIIGTSFGTWSWQEYDTIKGWVSQGNPPSGAAGGYGWFDLAALMLGHRIHGWWLRRRQTWVRADHGLVEKE